MDFRIDDNGGVVVLTALTDAGRDFRERLCYDGITRVNQDGIVIHHPQRIVVAIKEAGLTVEQ